MSHTDTTEGVRKDTLGVIAEAEYERDTKKTED